MKPSSFEPQIEEFVAKYSPEIAIQLRDARARLRSFFERVYELVFDNYNALVLSISKTPADLDRPEVEALVVQAIRAHEAALRAAPTLTTVIKMVAAKHRPRRPALRAVAARPAASPKGPART